MKKIVRALASMSLLGAAALSMGCYTWHVSPKPWPFNHQPFPQESAFQRDHVISQIPEDDPDAPANAEDER